MLEQSLVNHSMVQAISQSHQQIYLNTNIITLLTATQTLTNKTLTSPTINGGTLESISSLHMSNGSISLEGSTDDAHETTLTVTDPTADRTITFARTQLVMLLCSQLRNSDRNYRRF